VKLIYCPYCTDVVKLQRTLRRCDCGASWGLYHADGLHATVGGDAVPLGIDNADLLYQIQRYWAGSIGLDLSAFVIPQSSDRVIRMPTL
jgi:hypothetical protein